MPLEWPPGWPRTTEENRETGNSFKKAGGEYGMRWITFSEALNSLLTEVRRLDGTDLKVSTSLGTRTDGMPRAPERKPADPGVAIYFRRHGKPFVFACDRYAKIEANVRAVALTLEAKRGIERWGCATAEREFEGYKALPHLTDAAPAEPPHVVLGVAPDAPREVIEAAYKVLARRAHPDAGGSVEAMQRLNAARDALRPREAVP